MKFSDSIHCSTIFVYLNYTPRDPASVYIYRPETNVSVSSPKITDRAGHPPPTAIANTLPMKIRNLSKAVAYRNYSAETIVM